MKRATLAVALIIAAMLVLTACGSDESREDANDVHNGQVDKSAPMVISFNNHYPNVETKCDGFGHRIYVITHDSAKGDNLYVISDPTCQGPGTSYTDIVRSGEQPHVSEPPVSPSPIQATAP
jgi:hypothetical protein